MAGVRIGVGVVGVVRDLSGTVELAVNVVFRAAKFFHSLSKPLGELGQLLGAEKKQQEKKDDDTVGSCEVREKS